jgi:hypothetical protein
LILIANRVDEGINGIRQVGGRLICNEISQCQRSLKTGLLSVYLTDYMQMKNGSVLPDNIYDEVYGQVHARVVSTVNGLRNAFLLKGSRTSVLPAVDRRGRTSYNLATP